MIKNTYQCINKALSCDLFDFWWWLSVLMRILLYVISEKLRELQSQIEQYKTQLADSETRLQESREKVDQLQSEYKQTGTHPTNVRD